MKKHTLNIALIVLALSASAGSQAAVDYFLEIDGVKGESTEQANSGVPDTAKKLHKPRREADGQQTQYGPVLKVKPKGVQEKPKAKARVKPAPSQGIEPDEIDSK